MWQLFGQDKVLSLLENSIKRGKTAHAYLFTGPAHTGKMTLAVNLAQALNCESITPPCGVCKTCQKIAAGKHTDVQIIELTSQSNAEEKQRTEIGVEQIKEIQRAASLPPFEGKNKVFIINGAEFLSSESSNRLLKTLEEPNPQVVFILVTVSDGLLLPTVVSRCQRFDLRPVVISELEKALQEKWKVEPEKAAYLSRLSKGCPGWAVTALDDSGLTEEIEQKLAQWLELFEGDIEQGFSTAARLATQFSRNRAQVQETLGLWVDVWHDVLMVKTGCENLITYQNHIEELKKLGERAGLLEIKDFIYRIQKTQTELKQNVNAKLALEVLILNIPGRKKPGAKPALVK